MVKMVEMGGAGTEEEEWPRQNAHRLPARLNGRRIHIVRGDDALPHRGPLPGQAVHLAAYADAGDVEAVSGRSSGLAAERRATNRTGRRDGSHRAPQESSSRDPHGETPLLSDAYPCRSALRVTGPSRPDSRSGCCPVSCAGGGNIAGEASIGVRIGQLLRKLGEMLSEGHGSFVSLAL